MYNNIEFGNEIHFASPAGQKKNANEETNKQKKNQQNAISHTPK